jgi:hypothetical protein
VNCRAGTGLQARGTSMKATISDASKRSDGSWSVDPVTAPVARE